MHVHPRVELVRNGQARQRTGKGRAQRRWRRNPWAAGRAVIHIQRWRLAAAEVDATRQRTVVAEDAVVGHLEEGVPAMQEDSATTLRAVDDREAIDARRVTQEVTRAVVTTSGAGRAGRAISRAVVQVPAAIRELTGGAITGDGVRVQQSPEVDAVVGNADTAGEHRDAGTFVGTHQRG